MQSQSRITLIILIAMILSGCAWAPKNADYQKTYAHLSSVPKGEMTTSEYQLIILVCARHLDYSNSQNLLKTVVKHPQDGSLFGDVGHAWVLLSNGDEIWEGGHSGERGIEEPKFFDGVMDLVENGDPNPVRYMTKTLKDGYFETGSGQFKPTYAIKKRLTKEQYHQIVVFINKYDYTDYALTDRQCVKLVQDIANMAGLSLESEVTVPICQYVRVGNQHIQLWQDPKYCKMTFLSPDILEKSMMEAVFNGEAEYALPWYRKNRKQEADSYEWSRLIERLFKVYLLS